MVTGIPFDSAYDIILQNFSTLLGLVQKYGNFIMHILKNFFYFILQCINHRIANYKRKFNFLMCKMLKSFISLLIYALFFRIVPTLTIQESEISLISIL